MFPKRPSLNFFGLFQSVGIKEGGSQVWHLDWCDDPKGYAIVICLGPGWTGAHVEILQLGKTVPTRNGTVIILPACKLVHRCGELTGKRLAITCFTCANLASDAFKFIQQAFAEAGFDVVVV